MKTLLIQFNDSYFADVAERLIQEGVDVKYLFTIKPQLYASRPGFHKVQIVDENKLCSADSVMQLNYDQDTSLSQELIEGYRDLESLFLSITDRLSFYPKTVQFRKQIYYELLLFWYHFLTTHCVEAILFPRVPHVGYDVVLYFVAKRLGIKTILVRETMLDDLVLITDQYQSLPKVPSSYLANKTVRELKDNLHQNILEQTEKASHVMDVNIQDNKMAFVQNQAGWLDALNPKTIKAVLSLIHNPFANTNFSISFLDQSPTWWDYYQTLIVYFLRNRSKLKYYQQIAVKPDLTQKFVYLALHYQPERTSMPEGGVFENQWLMVDILAKSLPKGWFLYIKEHPNQFARSDTRLVNFRYLDWYDRIKKYANVRLVSLSINSQRLLRHCQAAVTLTGSTGWEAMIMGKPVITFTASAWYSPCQSCYVVTSVSECRQALKSITRTSASTVKKDLLRYLNFYQNKFVVSAYDDRFSELSKLPYETLINNLSTAIAKHLKK